MNDERAHKSLWTLTTPPRDFPALPGDLTVDVAFIGGGMAGLTTAWLLKRAGRWVAVLESPDALLAGAQLDAPVDPRPRLIAAAVFGMHSNPARRGKRQDRWRAARVSTSSSGAVSECRMSWLALCAMRTEAESSASEESQMCGDEHRPHPRAGSRDRPGLPG